MLEADLVLVAFCLQCDPSSTGPLCAQNRVVQGGLRVKLEVFRTASKGWGVRAGQDIPVRASCAVLLCTCCWVTLL